MSQMSFADFFDQVKHSDAVRTVVQPAPVVPQPPAAPRLMSIDTARKQFIRLFNQTARHLHRWDVFSDFVRLAASELDIARIRTPENIEQSGKICARYDANDIRNFHELFNLMVSALEAKFHDFIGSIFMELELGSGGMGQYFTPYSVQSMMARMLIPGIQEKIAREGIATISDPACGSAGMIIAYAECLLEADVNPSAHLFASCIDIDPIAADMAFIQLSLLGIAAEVVTGNTLTMQFNRVRYTPVYYLNNFEERLNSQRRIKAMMDFMRNAGVAA
ncbi:N-6 DNA methylase [Leclercia adecarboxylata]|uniref:site-specific DNA-methyltransferase (adenine-specific) n=1 Tax=Leclercia adecarboxylata TaxID=83655 RepID=A0A482M1K2_9ENTR|nr:MULTISPECIES: N-6 DNA methylase [Enterobacteriaceae]MDC6624190.1 N-6 DNA methylase [Leclercia adecarboxylata]MDC6635099.1 N-6 DNA methylase [Leclercia adecarboxylata]MDC6641017.1 N-6 DNA methylase [Leclercia adecarboxylata]MDC6651323.1 N-6 DNA methylase [Leclercia adecarboxylata]MDC6656202.1 N-6 DNA methylase [Leclercia adecarboxylata]